MKNGYISSKEQVTDWEINDHILCCEVLKIELEDEAQ